MFKPGQKLWHRTRPHSGTVQESDANHTYLVQDNGVELDFPTRDLTATPPDGAPAKPTPRGEAARAAGPAPVRALTQRDITPEHLSVLATIPPRTLQAVAAIYERTPKAGRFSALDPAQKLNLIADITAVPYRAMREHLGRPGELGLLMGKGLADSGKKNVPV